MLPPNTVYAPMPETSAWQEVTPGYYVPAQVAASWYPSPGGYEETGMTQALTPMPLLPPFPNALESNPRSLMISDPGNSSDLSTKWGTTLSIQTAPITSGLNSPPLIEKSWEQHNQTHGTSDEETSKCEPLTTSLGPENP